MLLGKFPGGLSKAGPFRFVSKQGTNTFCKGGTIKKIDQPTSLIMLDGLPEGCVSLATISTRAFGRRRRIFGNARMKI